MRLDISVAKLSKWVYLSTFVFLLAACGSKKVNEDRTQQIVTQDHLLSGDASYYADRFNGRKTASGELYDSQELTAAHRTLPFGTIVRVVDPKSNRSVRVRINDRGPFTKGRVIDVSGEAARELGMIQAGVIYVNVLILESP